MVLVNSTGLFSIMFLVFWLFAMPFIYPRHIEKYLTDRVTKRHLYIVGNFFVSYIAAGILLLFAGYYTWGGFILFGMFAMVGLMRLTAYDSFNLGLDVLYDELKTIAYYLFIAGVLLTGIIYFYGSNPKIGIILNWTVFINLSTTGLGLILSDKRTYVKKVKNTEQDLNEKEIDLDNLDIFSLSDFFANAVNLDLEDLQEGINSVLGHLVTDVYVHLIPEAEKPNDIDQLEPVINKYLLAENSDIPEKELHIIKVLLNYKKELTQWTKTSIQLAGSIENTEETNKKEQSNSKKKLKKTSKVIKKDIKVNKSKARSINTDNKPGGSTPPNK